VNTWIVVTGDDQAGALVAIARPLGGVVTAVVVGCRAVADAAASAGPDEVVWYPVPEGTPAEACAATLAADAGAAAPRVLLSTADPAARVLLGAVAARLGAPTVSAVRTVTVEGDLLVVDRDEAEGRVVETVEVAGPLAGIVEAADEPAAGAGHAPVREAAVAADGTLRVVATTASDATDAALATAARVVGIGLGLRARDDLGLIERLAGALGAAVACSLPVAEDMRWLDGSHVVGSSTQQIAPQLYVAVGLSGQPQHMSGVRGAKAIVAINEDAQAPIFRHCDYGIVGDLYQVVPALTAALGA
jgi:electron transfer flavoprotein alpha subunit